MKPINLRLVVFKLDLGSLFMIRLTKDSADVVRNCVSVPGRERGGDGEEGSRSFVPVYFLLFSHAIPQKIPGAAQQTKKQTGSIEITGFALLDRHAMGRYACGCPVSCLPTR